MFLALRRILSSVRGLPPLCRQCLAGWLHVGQSYRRAPGVKAHQVSTLHGEDDPPGKALLIDATIQCQVQRQDVAKRRKAAELFLAAGSTALTTNDSATSAKPERNSARVAVAAVLDARGDDGRTEIRTYNMSDDARKKREKSSSPPSGNDTDSSRDKREQHRMAERGTPAAL